MIAKAMALFKVPSLKRVNDCGETLPVKDSAAAATLSTHALTSQLSLSSSNSTKNGDVEFIKVVEVCKEKNDDVPIVVDESEGDAVYNKLFVKEHESPHMISPEPLQETSFFPKDDVDNVANFIDIRKLVGKSETNYYYSKANLSSRKKVEKIKMKKKRRGSLDNFDDSVDSRTNFLIHCIRASAYQGPRTVKKDGSSIQSVMKRRNKLTSIDSTLATEASHSTVGTRSGGKAVTFSHVDLREYERVPGDNPCVRGGVPLSIGWRHVQHNPICLDNYESGKGHPRDKIEMMVPASVRRSMLRDEFGASIHELNAAMKSVNISKRQRAHTIASEDTEVFEEVLESAKRKFKRVVGKAVSSKKQAEELWEASHEAVMNEYLQNASEGVDATHLVSDEGATDSLTS
mmetsp:Transcript_25804/g.36789  ORF Transcript_25804/g.36789 Transcript_25804/m.36789 type:complete len:403 (-) Transcript_25804:138-1346(-)